jgi:hypothetical protein
MGKVDVALALAVKLRERLLQGFAPATCEWRACQVSDTLPMAHVYLVDSTVRGRLYHSSVAPQAEHPNEEDVALVLLRRCGDCRDSPLEVADSTSYFSLRLHISVSLFGVLTSR